VNKFIEGFTCIPENLFGLVLDWTPIFDALFFGVGLISFLLIITFLLQILFGVFD
jgi:hypothetical protein